MKKPAVNIGMIGHVDHGKTMLVNALTGVWTDRHSEELKRGISIRLGYADVTFRRCPKCAEPECFTTDAKCGVCGSATMELRTVSFVDSPGHETLMATMLSGAAIMNGAVLVIAANEKCPQPQTKEHLTALDIIGIKNIVIVQNKIDLVSREETIEHYKQIKAFVRGTVAENAPIIPISAVQKVNIDVLIQKIEEMVKTPEHDLNAPARMLVARSFDINKPGTLPQDIKGGVIGGTLSEGKLHVGDKIEIKPGRRVEEGGRAFWEPINTTVVSIVTGGEFTDEATPGGLLGVGTLLDPAITKSDGLVGQVAGKAGTLPPVMEKIVMEVKLLETAVGTDAESKVGAIKTNEMLMLSIGTSTTVGTVTSTKEGGVSVSLRRPVCAEAGWRIAVSRRIGARWHLIGVGTLKG
jgi:translation initiation factor 2 subunit 3